MAVEKVCATCGSNRPYGSRLVSRSRGGARGIVMVTWGCRWSDVVCTTGATGRVGYGGCAGVGLASRSWKLEAGQDEIPRSRPDVARCPLKPERHLSAAGRDQRVPRLVPDHVMRADVAHDPGVPDVGDLAVEIEFQRPAGDGR